MLSITLPAGAVPGTIVQAPDGRGGTVQVQLPHGCAPGATVQVPLPVAPAAPVAPVAPVAPAPAPAGTDLTAEQRAALDAFAAMDADGDGELTADEIYQALSKNDADVTSRASRKSSPRPTPTATAPCLARSTSTRSPLTSFREAGSAASAGAWARSSPSRRPQRPPRRHARRRRPRRRRIPRRRRSS